MMHMQSPISQHFSKLTALCLYTAHNSLACWIKKIFGYIHVLDSYKFANSNKPLFKKQNSYLFVEHAFNNNTDEADNNNEASNSNETILDALCDLERI